MVYCKFCDCETDVEVDDAKGISCCVQCGRVLEDVAFSVDVTFQKDAAGESTVVGQFVNESGVARGIGRIHGGRVYAYQAESHERAQQRGRQHISQLVDRLGVKPKDESIESAHRVYKLALQKGFTRGRRTSHVAAACLYLLCRQDDKPFFLIDFSDALQVSVFSLGAVFLQLAKLLRLENQPQFTKPVDPSLYIHRFADKMFPDKASKPPDVVREVSKTAMRLVASMKRDWIQTGRRPSGVCGAALYIATHLHGHPKTKRQIVDVVHIGEFTLSKRLSEFATTPAGEMNKKQFIEHSEMIENQEKKAIENTKGEEAPKNLLGGCMHVAAEMEIHFRNGMCRECYSNFVQFTGGLYDGSNPPSFSKNREKERLLELMGPVDELNVELLVDGGDDEGKEKGAVGKDVRRSGRNKVVSDKGSVDASGRGVLEHIDVATVKAAESYVEGFDAAIAKAEKEDAKKRKRGSVAAVIAAASAYALEEAASAIGEDQEGIAVANGANILPLAARGDFALQREDEYEHVDDDGNLSEISDSEIHMYLAEEEEVKCKEEIWNMMNQDWMERQEAKKAALEASLKAQEEQKKAMEAAAAAGIQYKRGRGRPLGSKSKPKAIATMPPAETPQEAAMRIIDDKKLSSKINYTVLAELFSNEKGSDERMEGKKGIGRMPPPAAREKAQRKPSQTGASVDNAMVGRSTKDEEKLKGKSVPQKRLLGLTSISPKKTGISGSSNKFRRLESLTGSHASPLSALSKLSSLNASKTSVATKGVGASKPRTKPKKVRFST